MSAPTKTDEPKSAQTTDTGGSAKDSSSGSESSSSVRSHEARVLELQGSAGNQAVASAMSGGPRGVQRAPKDDDANAPVVEGSRPGPTTLVGDEFGEDEPPKPPPVKVKGRELRRGPGQVGPGEAGAVDEVGRLGPTKKATVVPDHVIEHAYRTNPAKVLRGPTTEWYEQMWNAMKPRGFGDDPPKAFQSEGVILVAPNYPGQATDMPNIGPTTNSGLGQPLTGTAKAGSKPLPQAGPAESGNRDPMKDAYFRPVQGKTTQRQGQTVVAQPVTDDEVRAAFAADPGRVIRSPTPGFHLDGYRADGGKGALPDAFKVGDQIFIARRYRVEGVDVPPLAISQSTGGGQPAGVPKATTTSPIATAVKKDIGEASTDPGETTRPDIPLPAGGGQVVPANQVPKPAQSTADALTLRKTTAADTRARARAVEYTPLFAEWGKLEPVQRQERIERLINAQLASEGAPKVWVNAGDMRKGGASFAYQTWKIEISKDSLNNPRMSIDDFAELVDSATHEARHAVHHFRGLRIALSEKKFDAAAKIEPTVVAQARALNQRSDPGMELSEEAYGEAKEIYAVTHRQAQRVAAIQAQARAAGRELNPTDIVEREAIIGRREVTAESERIARAKLNQLAREGKTGTQQYMDALDDHRRALQASDKAHNDYVALPQETDSWRYGSAVRAAVTERLRIMDRASQWEKARTDAANAWRAANKAGDDNARRTAERAYVAANSHVSVAQSQLSALDASIPKQPRQQDFRTLAHEVPADPNAGRRAPGGALRPNEVRLPPTETGKADESAEPAGSGDHATTAQPRKGAPTGAPTGSGTGTGSPTVTGGPGTPTVAPTQQPGQAKPSPGTGPGAADLNAAKAATTISPAPGTDAGPVKKRTNVAQAGPLGVAVERVQETESIDGGTTTKKEKGKGFTIGGDDLLAGGTRNTTTTTTGDTSTATTTTAKGSFTKEGALQGTIGKQTETVVGTTPTGEPIKTSKQTTGSGSIGPQGLGANVAQTNTNAKGTQTQVGGGVQISDTSTTMTGTAGITNKSGFGAKVTVHGGVSVEASDPEFVDGEWQVTYKVTDTSGFGAGGSFSKPGGGGPSVGVNIGTSSADAEIEVRRFGKDGEKKAKEFKESAAKQVYLQRLTEKKLTTAEGALDMKVGESRGKAHTDTDTIGGSLGYSGVDIGLSKYDSITQGLTVKRVGDTKVHVTPDVSETHGKDASISAGGVFGNTKGSSETDTTGVTFEFDLKDDAGKKAYEDYCKTRIPPPPTVAKWIRSTKGHAAEGHDNYSFAGAGTIGWGDNAYQQKVTDAQGVHETAGGGQTHAVKLGRIRHLTGDDNVHSETDLRANVENGKLGQIGGQMTVGGESGSFNRAEFGKIFLGAKPKPGVDVKPSGEWTLSADISAKAFNELAAVNDKMLKANTIQEKIKIYGELAQERGPGMLSGQVRASGKKLAWNLQLKGDANFPGAAGRAKLDNQRANLAAQLKSKPDSASAVAREAKETIEALKKRLGAVSDETKYTDLPDELRQEQVDVVNHHISQFESLRSQALSLAMRGGDQESMADIRKRAAKPGGYDDVRPDQREVKQLRDSIQIKEQDIGVFEREIKGTNMILGRMMTSRGVRVYSTDESRVKLSVYSEHNGNAQAAWGQAKSMDERLKASVAKSRELRKNWDAGGDPQAWLVAMRALETELKEQISILKLELEFLQDAVREAYIVTTDEAIGKDWAYFQSIKADSAARSIAISGFDEE